MNDPVIKCYFFFLRSLSGKPIKSASFSPTSNATKETDWLEVQKMKLRERGGAGLNVASPTPLHPGATFRFVSRALLAFWQW